MDTELILGIVRVIVVLALLAPAVYWAARWYGRRHTGSTNLQIREVLPLGVNRALYVIEWDKRRYLLGVTPQAITLIDSVDQCDSGLKNGEETS